MSWWPWLNDLNNTRRDVAWTGAIVAGAGVGAEEEDRGDIMYTLSYLITAIHPLNLYCTLYHFLSV